MIEYVALGLAWLLLPLPFAVLFGKCVSMGSDPARFAPGAAEPGPPAAPAPGDGSAATTALPPVPGQRQHITPPVRVT